MSAPRRRPFFRRALVFRGAFFFLLLVAACQRSAPQAPAAPPAPMPAIQPAQGSVPREQTPRSTAAANDAGVTAHPAALPARPPRTSAQSGARCQKDADCALTFRADDACCNTCAPRALLAAQKAALDEGCASQDARCPEPVCRQVLRPVAVCRAGACVVDRVPND